MLHLNENIENQRPPQEELDTSDYLTLADVNLFVDEQKDNVASITTATDDIISSIDSLSTHTSFKEMIEEAVKNYLNEMKNAAS